MNAPLYQVADWNKHFETAKSRMIDACAKTYAPNKHGGSGWSNVMGEADGATIWGIWKMFLDICSRQSRPREGWLTADGKKTVGDYRCGNYRISSADRRRKFTALCISCNLPR